MQYLNKIFIVLIILSISVFGANSSVSFYFMQADGGTPYFCNPCYYSVYNTTGIDRAGRTAYGANSISLSLINNTDYIFKLKAEFIGFNSTETIISDTIISDKGYLVNISEINTHLKLAMISYDGENNWYEGGGLTDFISNKRTLYNFSYFKNITKSLGFPNINVYNGGANYSTTGTYSPTAFNQYDVIIVTPYSINGANGKLSTSVITALKNAISAGIKVFIPAEQLRLIYPSYLTRQEGHFTANTIRAHIYYVINNNSQYPSGYYVDGYKYLDFYGQKTHGTDTTWSFNVSKSNFGVKSDILIQYYGWQTASPYNDYNVSAYIYSVMDNNIFIVPEFITNEYTGNTYRTSPIDKALMYAVLTNYSSVGTTQHDVTIQGIETACTSAYKPVNNLACTIDGISCVTTGLSSSMKNISTLVLSGTASKYSTAFTDKIPSMPITSQTHYLLHNSYDRWDWFSIWRDGFTYDGNRQMWIIGNPSIPTSMNGQNNKNFSSLYLFINALNFYPTENQYLVGHQIFYSAKEATANFTFTSDVSDYIFNGYHNYYLGDTGSVSFIGSADYSCVFEYGSTQEWNITYYAGYNTSHFIKYNFFCYQGVHRLSYSEFVTKLPVNETSNWYKSGGVLKQLFAPVTITKQSDGTYKVLRTTLLEIDVSADGNAQHQIGIMETNLTANYRGIVVTPSNCSVTLYEGTHNYLCYAPAGYTFLSNSLNYESGTFSVSSDRIVTLQMQRIRKLALNIQVYDYEGNATIYLEGIRCTSDYFSAISDNNGICRFVGVPPNTKFNITITNPRTQDTINITLGTGDYYDTQNIDNNDYTCSNFDGNYTYPIYIGSKNLNIEFNPIINCGAKQYNKANVIINLDNTQTCVTDKDIGSCIINSVPIKYGAEYLVNATNSPEAIYLIKDMAFLTWIKKTNQTGFIYCTDNDCKIKFYVSLFNASNIGCDSSEFIAPIEPTIKTDKGFITGVYGLTQNLFDDSNKSVIGLIIVGITIVIAFALTTNGLISILAGFFVTFAISDLTLGRGNGYIPNEIIIVVCFILVMTTALLLTGLIKIGSGSSE